MSSNYDVNFKERSLGTKSGKLCDSSLPLGYQHREIWYRSFKFIFIYEKMWILFRISWDLNFTFLHLMWKCVKSFMILIILNLINQSKVHEILNGFFSLKARAFIFSTIATCLGLAIVKDKTKPKSLKKDQFLVKSMENGWKNIQIHGILFEKTHKCKKSAIRWLQLLERNNKNASYQTAQPNINIYGKKCIWKFIKNWPCNKHLR